MGYIFDFHDAEKYDACLEHLHTSYYLDLESRLFLKMMNPQRGARILDIGCGTGVSLVPLLDQGLNLTGIDPSLYMLDKACERLGQKVDLHRGSAEELPFEDNAFDTAFFFTSLEFSDRPAKAIEEACRVAKDQVIIAVLNRHAPLNMYRRCKGFFRPDIYTKMHFFSIWEIRQIVHAMLGKVPVYWRTTIQVPFIRGRFMKWVENLGVVQRSCCGTMICMRIKPVPKFRTRPLSLKLKTASLYKRPASGLVTPMRSRKS